MTQLKRLFTLAFVAAVSIALVFPRATFAQEEEDDQVAQLMEEMSSAAKVGQLFLVTFPGADVGDDALITELIRDYHVGGVVLLPENGNIANEGDTPAQVAALTGRLQRTAWEATRTATEELVDEEAIDPFIPLFVAANHEGNGLPFTSIISGTTPLPPPMALGATWDLDHAETVGQVAGRELRALGVNMLLGPSLDVLEVPRPESTGDLGVRSFGGEPFWVGQMGQAYIRGVHNGGGERVAVIAKHFPGLGTSDRSLDEEISTVQRTLEKLRQIDLAPFFAVAQADDPLARPDGLLVSHIRFQGLEGGRYAKTRPISVDSQGQVLQRLLGLPGLTNWREEGGVTVSDDLGVRALRRFYDPSEKTFNGRRIAQEAFFAGNDLLLLSQFALSDDWEDQMGNIRSTITFFRDKYEREPSFQVLVDEAVARILRLKLSLYNDTFSISNAIPNVERVDGQLGLGQEVLAAIGRDAITLLSPPSIVPSPPTTVDNIVIFTDARREQPCPTCAPVPYIDPLLLEDTFVRLYGPGATGQITPWRVTSFTFSQLGQYLNTYPQASTPTPSEEQPTPTPTPGLIELALQNADWVIFVMLDPTDDPPQSGAVRRFLAEQADALSDPHLVVLACDAPYYLDATEISKLSAYYVAYSRIEPFIEASVRAIFGEFALTGSPPVSVPGINYDLVVQTSPDPEQIITLHYEKVSETPEEAQPTPEATVEEQPTPEPTEESQPTQEPTAEGQATAEPRLKEGDKLRLRTGVIVDHNGHPVPDGTPVRFIFNYPQEGLEPSVQETTRGGVAETTITLDRPGQLDISIQADPVPKTTALQITVQEEGTAIVVPITPTPRPTAPWPTPTPTPNPEPETAETPQPTPTPENVGEGEPPAPEESGPLDLALALIGVFLVGGAGYYVVRLNRGAVVLALRLALWCTVGGLTLYLAYALHLPGAAWLREQSGVWAAGWIALFGSITPLAIAWVARWIRKTEAERG